MLTYISFKARILLGFLAIISLMAAISASSLMNLSSTERKLTEINDNLLPNALLTGQMARDIVLVHQFLSDVSASHSPAGYQDAEKSTQDFKQGLSQFRRNIAGNAAKLKQVEILEADFDRFYQDGRRMAGAYIGEGMESGNAIMQDFDHASYKLSSQMIKLRNAEVNAAKYDVNKITETTHQVFAVLWVMSITIIALALAIAVFLTRHLSKVIGIDPIYAKGIAKEIAAGDLSRSIKLDEDDKDSLLHAIKSMQQKLLARRMAEHKAAEEILRIKMALDNTSIGIMIADNERNIIYVNKSVVDAFAKIEEKICEQIPTFSTDRLVGSNMDDFYQNPAQRAELLAALTGTHSEDIALGGRTMMVVANPVIGQQNQRIGTVTEWHDRSVEAIVEKEVSAIVVAASMGDFSKRFVLQGKEGFFRELGESLNQMLYYTESGLNDLAQVLAALSSSDLTKTISNDYQGTLGQIKNDANNTVEKLKGIITQIRGATDTINSGAKEIAYGNNNLSYRTEQQASSLEQTAASMEELTSTVQANAENAKQVNQFALDTAKIAGQGGIVVDQVVATMQGIKESSEKIEAIISVIEDIAFQTNILAFNAAVQAAHAGAHGQGFAVVARDVRQLAQRAGASAEEIKNLISASVEKIDNGRNLAAQAGTTMQEILNAIQGVTGMISEITAASVEQSAGIEQINQAISQMDNVTQQNAALVEQAAAAAESMEEQAQRLAITVSGFKIHDKLISDNALPTDQEVAVEPPKMYRLHHRKHKEHPIWDAVKNKSRNARHSLENAITCKTELQELAMANGDWEGF